MKCLIALIFAGSVLGMIPISAAAEPLNISQQPTSQHPTADWKFGDCVLDMCLGDAECINGKCVASKD
jgi:hypothetical protein